LIRNHGEAVVEEKGTKNLVNMIGFNFRLGEIEAAIGRCQLAKGKELIERRKANVRYLEKGLSGLTGIKMPTIGPANDHVYYVHAIEFDEEKAGLSRASFVDALQAELPVTQLREHEGPLISAGYTKPIYMTPIYRNMIGYGTVQCPFRCPHYDGKAEYHDGLCPNAELAYQKRLIIHEMMRPPMTHSDLDDVIAAFHKVSENATELARDRAREIV
jgi:dTDP-4-amino-4,6-dideoxygalactose transaminase